MASVVSFAVEIVSGLILNSVLGPVTHVCPHIVAESVLT